MSYTQIRDREAFALCVVGVEDPVVRQRLESPYGPGVKVPGPVEVPIAVLLGPDGAKLCGGSRLDPVDGSLELAVASRLAWARAEQAGREPAVPEPAATELTAADFTGAGIVFTFAPATGGGGWQLGTVYPDPDGNADPPLPERYWQDRPDQVPELALFRAAVYDDGSAERYLRRLHSDLLPGRPFPQRQPDPGSRGRVGPAGGGRR